MAFKLNNITFNLGQGGSGRIANGTDYISGMMFYNNTRPAAMLAALPGGVDNFASGSVMQIFSPADAKAIGIDNTNSDETASVCKIVITNGGATGDAVTLKLQEWNGGSGKGLVTLGTYTNLANDNIETVVDGLVAAINAGTNVHGYVAADTGDTETTVFITARPGIGTYFNSGTPLTKVVTGAMAGTITQPTGAAGTVLGVASKLAVYYYHIQRYFAIKPDGTLYIGIWNTAGEATFSDIDNMLSFSKGAIVQMGIWDDQATFALSKLTAIQTRITANKASYRYLSSCLFAADIKALATPLTTLAGAAYNLATLTANNVSALIDNDGNGTGWDLFNAQGKSISSMGAALGCVSEVQISEDMGQPVPELNCDDGVEFDTLMFGDGTLFNTVSKSQLDALNNNRYIFLSSGRPLPSGSYYSDDHAAIAYTSDYAWIHDNRVIDRVIKDLGPALASVLKGRLKLNTDGTMTAQTIANIVALGGQVIQPLIASDDLAGDANNFDASKWILVNPTQKPNISGNLIVGVKLAENAIAHAIIVPIGFGTF
jgi:hypothetical protein